MTGNQQSHQIFRIVMHTPVPDLSSINVDVKSVMESMRPQITSVLTSLWNVDLFVSNGFSSVQSASVGNIQFQLNPADDKIFFTHIDIVYEVDVKSDPTWIEIGQIILLGSAVIITVAGILTGNPVLIAAGVIIAISAILITVYEIVHEIVSVVPGGIGGAAILLAVGGVVGGYFLWTATGREKVAWVGGQAREGLRQVGSTTRKGIRRKLKGRKKRKISRRIGGGEWH